MPTVSQNLTTKTATLLESEVIEKLRKDLEKTKTEVLRDFWQEIEAKGTPILEEIQNDGENILCTFIFEGDQHTESVFVNLPPFSRISPNDFSMSQIEKTDVWFASVTLPKESRFAYSLVVNFPFQNTNPESPKSEIKAFQSASQADLLNQNRFGKRRSFVETPNAKQQKYLEKSEEIESGKVGQFIFKSELLNNERTISVYTPSDFDASKTYPLLVLFDEEIYIDEINAPTILDNLLAENLIPEMITVFIGNAENARSKELVGNTNFCDFINIELFDWIKNNYKIADNLKNRILGGASFGGLCAVFTAVCCPNTFGKILSQSGSFWKHSDTIFNKLSEQNSNKQRFYLDAGIYEIEQKNGINLLEATRKLHDILLENGYAVDYQEFKGGHGAINWRGTFADGLIFLTEDLMEKQKLVGNPNLF